ncbi:hypothetical protein ACFP8W_26410, partial [Nocardioides hankookensis]
MAPSPFGRSPVFQGMCDGYHHGTLPTAPPDRTALTRRATIAAGAGLLMAGTLGASTGAIADTGRSP